jgi:hypothetical protein
LLGRSLVLAGFSRIPAKNPVLSLTFASGIGDPPLRPVRVPSLDAHSTGQ